MRLSNLLLLFLALGGGFHASLSAQMRVHVLGTAQDAGRPQVGCTQSCCVDAKGQPRPHEAVVSLGITQADGPASLLEATPDLTAQWNALTQLNNGQAPKRIFITHAHIGHYTGLMYLGREAMNSQLVEVFGTPRLIEFLQRDQPWKQLCDVQNIWPQAWTAGDRILLENGHMEALSVPHRDEVSDTYGFIVQGPNKRLLFLPDIDKWERWETDLDSLLQTVDYALVDATFYSDRELPGRNMAEIPHPFVLETLALSRDWPAEQKAKLYFIHFNHSNPLLDPKSRESKHVEKLGYHIARTGMHFDL
ncbi:MAG: pyrroloquinoline quinone biosynthesis protein PqqB [Flavobacteriia bacterium]|nr:pyrroloquinoline quinone biosynthesis protein PqqB [Flavobacteriia bacterium]